VRRGANYRLPPIGSGHHVDAAHLRRQEWTGRLLIWGILIAPVVYFIGWDCGWW